jgi:hypothetical protein
MTSPLLHVTEQHPITAVVGTATTLSGTIMGWMLDSVPVLQVVSLLVAIVAGILTAMWYWHQLHIERLKAAELIATAKIAANAVTAEANIKADAVNAEAQITAAKVKAAADLLVAKE